MIYADGTDPGDDWSGDLGNLIYALRQDSPLGHWCDGEQAADTITTLAALLDGVMADDPQAIRDAALWLATNRPEGGEG